MEHKELSELTDQELIAEAKKRKKSSLLIAFTIGIMIGIIFYSIYKNTIGFFTLIPLYFIHKLINNSADNKALEEILKQRNLKLKAVMS
jgi:hypothetical protein